MFSANQRIQLVQTYRKGGIESVKELIEDVEEPDDSFID